MSLPNTSRTREQRERALAGVRRLFFLGVGGVHMWALAMLAKERGYDVVGADRAEGEYVGRLRAAGIPVFVGDVAAALAALRQADVLIYTLAISPEDPLYRAAAATGKTLFSRADFLGFLMDAAPTRICVAGCHGKSTTTALLCEMLWNAGREPTVLCGAKMRQFDSSLSLGGGALFVAEACEYRDSFLCLSPTLGVVLNVGHDHADYFPDLAAVKRSFAQFARQSEGILVNADDDAAMEATAEARGRRMTFGLSSAAMLRAEKIVFSEGTGRFSLTFEEKHVADVALQIPGRHNIYNALAAAGAALLCGLSSEEVRDGLALFRGAARRFEYKGRLCGARVFDDYAHHPDEITATLQTAREMVAAGGRLFAVFQPHTYTRTAALWGELCEALRLADRILLADIYAAREAPLPGVTSRHLAAAVGTCATYHAALPELATRLAEELAPNDLLLVMGAGDIDVIFREFSKKDFTL